MHCYARCYALLVCDSAVDDVVGMNLVTNHTIRACCDLKSPGACTSKQISNAIFGLQTPKFPSRASWPLAGSAVASGGGDGSQGQRPGLRAAAGPQDQSSCSARGCTCHLARSPRSSGPVPRSCGSHCLSGRWRSCLGRCVLPQLPQALGEGHGHGHAHTARRLAGSKLFD